MRRYHEQLARHENLRCLHRFLPQGLTDWLRLRRYRREYPHAVVTAGSRVESGADIATGAIIRNSKVCRTVSIGRFTTLGEQCRLAGLGRISIGQFCSIGPECSIRSDNHKLNRLSTYPFNQIEEAGAGTEIDYDSDPVVIGNDVWLGEGVTVLPGARIADGCVVAARTVVTRGEYPPFSIIAGVPGKVIRTRIPEDRIDSILTDPWWDKPEGLIFGELRDELVASIGSSEL